MLPFVSLLATVLIGCAGLVVDVRNGYVVHGLLQRAADDGALSAMRWITQVDDAPDGPSADVAGSAVAEAMRVVQQELASEGVAGISAASAALTGGQLSVTVRANVPTFFLGLFGIARWVESARAEITVPSSGNIPVPGGGSAGPIVTLAGPQMPLSLGSPSGAFEQAVLGANGAALLPAPVGPFGGVAATGGPDFADHERSVSLDDPDRPTFGGDAMGTGPVAGDTAARAELAAPEASTSDEAAGAGVATDGTDGDAAGGALDGGSGDSGGDDSGGDNGGGDGGSRDDSGGGDGDGGDGGGGGGD